MYKPKSRSEEKRLAAQRGEQSPFAGFNAETERLLKKIATLEQRLDDVLNNSPYQQLYKETKARVIAVDAEAKRLRAAIEKIRDHYVDDLADEECKCVVCASVRDALTPKEKHKPGCPRLQFWDAGEHEAPCTCAKGENNE